MVVFPDYTHPGIYLSAKHSPPSWSTCPGSNTNPCPCCGTLCLSPPCEMKKTTNGNCMNSNCNCFAKGPVGSPNENLSSSESCAKEELRNRPTYGKQNDTCPIFNTESNKQPAKQSKSTQCNEENPAGNTESDCRGYCQVFCTQPYYQSEVALPYCENQSYEVCVSNTINPPTCTSNTCCKFGPLHDHFTPCPCMGLNCPYYQRPFCPFWSNTSGGNCSVPPPNGTYESPLNQKPTTSDKAVFCKPEDFMALIGGKFQERGRDMRNGLQDSL